MSQGAFSFQHLKSIFLIIEAQIGIFLLFYIEVRFSIVKLLGKVLLHCNLPVCSPLTDWLKWKILNFYLIEQLLSMNAGRLKVWDYEKNFTLWVWDLIRRSIYGVALIKLIGQRNIIQVAWSSNTVNKQLKHICAVGNQNLSQPIKSICKFRLNTYFCKNQP